MSGSLSEVVGRWAEAVGLAPQLRPGRAALGPLCGAGHVAWRPGAPAERIAAWEARHGFTLPRSLRAWLSLSDGLYGASGPLVHPLAAIGPMIPFARVPELLVQPESWFELGNPPTEPVCIDLAYRWPGGCCPVFTSGDDERGTRPRIIAPSFEAWLVRLLAGGGREYWFEPGFQGMGDPWPEHRLRTPPPALSDRLRGLAPQVQPLLGPEVDDRSIASRFGLTRSELEAIVRHVQHAQAPSKRMSRGA